MIDVAGEIGPTGTAGLQGRAGEPGARGPAGIVDRWISYRAFWFDYNTVALRNSDTNQVSEIADYMRQNPSLQVGIDGSGPSSSDVRDQDLGDRRADSVYDALIKAGVPSSRIETGTFGDAQLARHGRVEVLLRTNN